MKLKEYKSSKNSKKVLLIHGAYMSSWNMKELAIYLQKKGITSYTIDLKGHGKGETLDVKNTHYSDYIKELKTAIKKIGKCTVCGISMGGMLATEICNEKNVQKLILLSTPYDEMPKNSKFILLNLKLLPQLIKGKIQVNAKDLLNTASKKTIEKINKNATYEPANVMQESNNFKKVSNKIKKCKKPIIMAYGSKDYTINQESIKKIPKKVKVKMFEGMGHLLIHEQQKKKVFEFVSLNI